MAFTFTGYGKPVKVKLSYTQEEVAVLFFEKVTFDCPKEVSVDFELGGYLTFFKQGYESKFIRISKDSIFQTYHVSLQELKNKSKNSSGTLDLKKVSFINYVTNFTEDEVTDLVKTKLNACKIATYSANKVFTNAVNTQRKYSIGAEVIRSISKNGAYTSSHFLYSYNKINWSIIDNETNKIVLEFPTEGFFLAYFKPKKGLIVSERLKEITVYSIEEACQKLINSEEFSSILK